MLESKTYEQRVQEQIDQYLEQPIHGLPDIFHHWSHHHILPGLQSVFGASSISDFYVGAVEEAWTRNPDSTCRILSIGCGDGDVELELIEALIAKGSHNFRLEGVDVSPVLIERFSEKIEQRNFTAFASARIEDINVSRDHAQYNVIMANHCLHHFVELEQTFSFIFNSLADGGIFVTSDMIGRNGHMRWPECEAVLQAMWPMLNDSQKFHHQLMRLDDEKFQDHDCSGEGFEGIRAQDILHLCLDTFKPYRFFGYGGFIDLLVDRGYGPGYDANAPFDQALISFLAKLNDMMLDSGMIKPTMMAAYFTKEDRGQHYYRNRQAQQSVRASYDTPEWVNFRPIAQ